MNYIYSFYKAFKSSSFKETQLRLPVIPRCCTALWQEVSQLDQAHFRQAVPETSVVHYEIFTLPNF